MLKPMLIEPLKDGTLRRPALIPQSVAHKAAFLFLCLQSRRAAEVGLVGQDNHEFGLLAIGGVLSHPRSDLAQRGALRRPVRTANRARRSDRPQSGGNRRGKEKNKECAVAARLWI